MRQQETIPLYERTGNAVLKKILPIESSWSFKDGGLALTERNWIYWSGIDEAVKAKKECRSLPQAKTTKEVKGKEHRTGLLKSNRDGKKGRTEVHERRKRTCSIGARRFYMYSWGRRCLAPKPTSGPWRWIQLPIITRFNQSDTPKV